MVQPDCWAVMPFDPVSWYGVDKPVADSGLAGTTMLQLTLAAAAGALADADPLGHGAADAVLPGEAVPEAAVVGAAEPEAAVVGAAEPEAAVAGAAEPEAAVVGAAEPEAAVAGAAEPEAAVVGAAEPEAAVAGAVVAVADPAVVGAAEPDAPDAAGEAQLASAESLTCEGRPLETATRAPTVTASATGMPMVTALRRLAMLSCRRRHADRCLLGMQSTSMP
jgi:hypothetical protein